MMNATILSRPAFGNVQPPPANVPQKFQKEWESLPGCCRDFYLKPGEGCCAGAPEPSPKKMSPGNPVTRAVRGVMDWFRQLFGTLVEDLKALFGSARKQ